jgi:hypothetical protein
MSKGGQQTIIAYGLVYLYLVLEVIDWHQVTEPMIKRRHTHIFRWK